MKHKIITLLIILLPIVAFAQENLYSIKGCVVIRNSENESYPEPFMNVIVTDTTEKIHIGDCKTDFDGMYYIDSIPKGRYLLSVSAIGSESYDTILTINSDYSIDTVKIYNRWYNINGNRIWERQLEIGVPDYADIYREIYIDYRTAVNDFNKTLDKKIQHPYKELHNALKRVRNINTILTHLRGVSLKAGYVLDVYYYYGGVGGGTHYYCHRTNEAKKCKNPPMIKGENILNYMNVEFTPEEIWSAFQLEISNRYLYKFGTGYYSESWLVFSIKDEIISSFYVGRNKTAQELKGKLEELPPIKNKVEIISDSTAELTAYFWNNWLGLVEEKVQVKREGTSVKFLFTQEKYDQTDMTGKVLVPYNCGVIIN